MIHTGQIVTQKVQFSPLMIISLLSLVYFSSSICQRASSGTFDKLIRKNPISVVLFTSTKCLPCHRVKSFLDSLSGSYSDSIGFYFVEFETASDVTLKYNISYAPSIAIFKDGNFRSLYLGEWSKKEFQNFFDNLINADIIYLDSAFDVFELQHNPSGSLIFSSSDEIDETYGILDSFLGLIAIGVINNKDVVRELNFSKAVLTRPKDFFTYSFNYDEEVTVDKVSELIRSPFIEVNNVEQLTATETSNTLVALLDTHNPSQQFETIRSFRTVQKFFDSNLSFQYCDFFTCSQLVRQIGIIKYSQPVFCIALKEGQKSRFEPLLKTNNVPEDVLNFCKFQLLGIPIPQEKQVVQLPKLHAPEFITSVGDYTKNVILYVASPVMQLYDECAEKARVLYQAFQGVKTFSFYEYNPLTEHVQGLSMPQSDQPQFSVWPASKEPHGSSFIANLPIEVILDNIVKLTEGALDDDQVQDVLDKIQELRQAEKAQHKSKNKRKK